MFKYAAPHAPSQRLELGVGEADLLVAAEERVLALKGNAVARPIEVAGALAGALHQLRVLEAVGERAIASVTKRGEENQARRTANSLAKTQRGNTTNQRGAP